MHIGLRLWLQLVRHSLRHHGRRVSQPPPRLDERDELSASEPAQKRRMLAALEAAQPAVIKTPQVPDNPECCVAAAERYGNFLGPFIE